MRGRPGRGAVFGGAAGCALGILLILLPRAMEGDYYEVTDPLVFMGIPLVVIGAAIGALVGASPHVVTDGPTETRPSTHGRVMVAIVAVGAAVLAGWLLLWAIGAVDPSPLGIW
jgi:drug/metabolite transporter (DMT)-like permease